MIVVDSSVWIDYFRGISTAQAVLLDRMLYSEPIGVGDLILAEVLQGFRYQHEFDRAQQVLATLVALDLGGHAIALLAAKNFRLLRSRGYTVRKTIDTIIATRCIEDGHYLLYRDRDFDPFVRHLGLKPA